MIAAESRISILLELGESDSRPRFGRAADVPSIITLALKGLCPPFSYGIWTSEAPLLHSCDDPSTPAPSRDWTLPRPPPLAPTDLIRCAAMPPAPARVPWKALAFLVVLAIGGGLTPRLARAQPAELLPSFHTLYEDLEALVARGLLPSYPIHTRPLVRMDVARALIEARDRDPALEGDLHYQRLSRELAREYRDLDAAPAVKETGPLVDVGPREQRFRVAMAGHARGDYDEKRAIHLRLPDESSLSERMSLQI